jgi:NAD(P)-dependent dehydrogenase (short-subunit alcohol dehydrogenase family)
MTPTEMQGKICLVTGSTSGLGKATAFALAKLHATVILGCRDQQRGEVVLAEIKAASPASTVDLLLLDLSGQHSIRTAVTAFEHRYDHLDVLINNAAVFARQRTLTPDGYETMFATNHLGPFLLTNLLLSRLKAAPLARILTLTPPTTTKIAFEDLQAEHSFHALQAFRVSKACNLYFTSELAHRLASTNVTVNAFYPGLVKTLLMSEAPVPLRWLNSVFGQAPEPVAERLASYASSPEVQGMTGVVFRTGRQPRDARPSATDRAVEQQLWEASLALAPLDEVPPRERVPGGKK